MFLKLLIDTGRPHLRKNKFRKGVVGVTRGLGKLKRICGEGENQISATMYGLFIA